MPEMILPGVYIETRAEGLIVPGRVTVGNVGVVGTASKGPIGEPTLLSSYTEARQVFGKYDSFYDDDKQSHPRTNSLTLIRALEQVFDNGATTVFAVRVADIAAPDEAKSASYILKSLGGDSAKLTAKTHGTWGNDLQINVTDADEDPLIEGEDVPIGTLTLRHTKVAKSARNRVTHFDIDTGETRVISGANILYDTGTPVAGQVKIDTSSGGLTFLPAVAPAGNDRVTATYAVKKDNAVKVTLRLGTAEEVYTVVNGEDLAADINAQSSWAEAKADATNGDELATKSSSADSFVAFKGGTNGEGTGADYAAGLEALINEDVQIVVAAGQDDGFGNTLHKHCQKASSDLIKRDRIAVVGSALKGNQANDAFLDELRSHNVSSDRVIFVAPGIQAVDTALDSPQKVTLPGAYAAAAVAGLLASFSAHISLTNKNIGVDGLEVKFNSAQLQQLVQNRVLALEERKGFRIVKGITTDEGAFQQITTRRIVDYAKFGVRSAAQPYIGLLNNDRVRGALRATINSFLTEMVEDEMLVSYELAVTATRDEEKKGIAKVTIVLRPTFSIDFIKVTMNLE
jgi:hypothetical protein